MCIISFEIKSENDLYFAITNTILSISKESFTAEDVVKELRQNNITEANVVFAKGQLRKCVDICIQNLVEHGKVIEEPRKYQLVK